MRVILNTHGDVKDEAGAIWREIVGNNGLAAFSSDIISLYEQGYRTILSEILSNQIEYYTGAFRSYLSWIDVGAIRYLIEGGHTLTYEDVIDSAENGSELAKEIIECFESLPIEVQDHKEFDVIVGNSVYTAYPSNERFEAYEREVFRLIDESHVPEDFGDRAYVVSFRPSYGRVVISDVCRDRLG